jgi:hypothetical protein
MTVRGFIHLEMLASIGLTIVLVALFAVATLQYAAVRRENDTRRLLQLAAMAELDRIRAGIHPVPVGEPEQPPASQPGEIVVRATATAGEGAWRGLTCVRVVASKHMAGARIVAVELRAFVAGEAEP